MSNAITAFNEEFWSAEMQQIFFKENVAIMLANTTFREILNRGDTLQKPYRSHPFPVDYTKGSDITSKDRFGTEESLTVATAKVVPFYVDDIDKVQNKWDMATKYAQDGQRVLNNILDQAVASQVTNANSYLDEADVGGTAGTNISVTASNIDKIFTGASRKLDALNIPMANRFALIGPQFLATLRQYIGGKETDFGDIVGANGKIMNRFGFELFYSNNVYYTATWTPANSASAADTVTINGAVLEFVATVDSDEASTAYIGVDIGGSVATDIDNLVAAINDSGTEGSTYGTYDALNDGARWNLITAGIVATNSSNTAMTIVAYGDIVVAASEAADPWSSQRSQLLFGLKGATDLVIQKKPNIAFRVAEKRLGRYVYPWMLYGIKNFADMDNALVGVRVNASNWT